MQGIRDNLGGRSRLENGRHPTGKGFVYLRDGVKHREKGPAEIWNNGYKAWYFKGRKHRVEGPAVTYPDGREEWWVNGKMVKSVDPTKPTPGTKVNLSRMGRRR
jgi:hypothetical protein